MKLTFHGHSCFTLEIGDKTILIDPFVEGNPQSKIKADELTADFILLTHAHADHCGDAENIGKRTGALLLGIWEISEYYNKKGLKTHPMNIGGTKDFGVVKVKMVHAVHSSSLPNGEYGGLAAGFVVYNEETCIYFAGDTALTLDMQLIPMTCPPLDIAVLPIGDNFTMGYEEALIASDFVHCERIIGCHYDTFPYIEIDKDQAISRFKEEGKELILLEPGQSITNG
jgi:L-ascorbate metabolism protein UlaG (beta-lactamase superfamily)